MKLLVTGGAGFIGSHFIRHMLAKYPSYQIINLDKLTYAGDLKNCEDYAEHPHYEFVEGDISDRKLVDDLASDVDVILNFAAETHVDNSIEDSAAFIQTNVVGTQVLLEASKKYKHKKYLQISTDEVYGDLKEGHFTEESILKPSSPYSASKAGGDLLCLAYRRTYDMPIMITRCSNNYGTHQFPEKIIPFFIQKLMKGEKVPVYGDGSNIRDWLHVTDHCRAIDLVLHEGKSGEVYNIGANNERPNLEITKKLLKILDLPEDRIEFVQDRLGHDIRYAVDASKIKGDLGWTPQVDFEEGFEEMVRWYMEAPSSSPQGGGSNAVFGYHTANIKSYDSISQVAKEMKKEPTPAEALLWEKLRKKSTGYRFRRHHIIHNFVVDFVCLKKNLVVEVDGTVHKTQKEYDRVRTDFLNQLGYKVIRFSNEAVLNDTESVFKKIRDILNN